MKTILNYFQERFGPMILMLISIVLIMVSGGLSDLANGFGSLGLWVLVALIVIYTSLFVWDYRKWKNLQK